jgi:capsular polysaccharide biosynthesis protein
VELEAKSTPPADRSWSPVVPVESDTVAVAMFQWKRLPITRSIVLKYLALFCVIVIGTAMFAYVISSLGPAKYGARQEVDYPLAQENPSGGQLRQDRVLSTQLVAMKSQAVLQPIADKYNMTLSELSKIVSVKVLQDSEVLRVEVDHGSKEKALALVGAVVNGYMKSVGPTDADRQEAFLNGQIKKANASIATLQAQVADLESRRLAQGPNQPQSADELQKQAQLTDLLTQRSDLANQLNTVSVQQLQAPRITQLTQPYLVSGKVSPKPVQGAIAGFLAGIMIGALVIGLLIRRLLKRQPDSVG